MPIDYKKNYVGWWHQFSKYIRTERAGNACEQCGAKNGYLKFVSAEFEDGFTFVNPENIDQLVSLEAWLLDCDYRVSKIVLTVAHLDYEGGVCRCKEIHGIKCAIPSHVLALCQACHLRMDLPRHIEKRRNNLAVQKDSERGLFEVMDVAA